MAMKGWMIVQHIVPLEDIMQHETCGVCSCVPVVSNLGTHIEYLHQAHDGRELEEQGKLLH